MNITKEEKRLLRNKIHIKVPKVAKSRIIIFRKKVSAHQMRFRPFDRSARLFTTVPGR